MLKKLSNRGEAFVHGLLAPPTERHGADVYRKVRIADVVDIDKLNSRELGRFGLMGHFDFVITDGDHRPQFAIEFDGNGHDDKNDHLKDEICRRASLALFRLNSSSSQVKIKQVSFVAYLVDVWFFGREFERMQARGELSPDEPFMMSGFLKPTAKNIFDTEFDFTFDAMARLRKLLNSGNPLEHLNASSISMKGPHGEYAAFAHYGGFFGRFRIAIHIIGWGAFDDFSASRELSEFCHALAYHDLCKEIEAANLDGRLGRPARDIKVEIACLKAQRFQLILGLGSQEHWS
jgi:hypothetical protein